VLIYFELERRGWGYFLGLSGVSVPTAKLSVVAYMYIYM